MTSQPRHTSALEAITQAAIGFPVGWVLSLAVVLLGFSPAITATLITVLMFLISAVRSYLIRRWFDRRQRNKDEDAMQKFYEQN